MRGTNRTGLGETLLTDRLARAVVGSQRRFWFCNEGDVFPYAAASAGTLENAGCSRFGCFLVVGAIWPQGKNARAHPCSTQLAQAETAANADARGYGRTAPMALLNASAAFIRSGMQPKSYKHHAVMRIS